MPDGRAPTADVNERRAGRALDATNFFLADVSGGLGPYLAIYLLTEQHWDEARIGIVMSIATLAGILAQTPGGALIDAVRQKRLMMVGAAAVVTAASLLLPFFPNFWPVAVSQGVAHAAGVIFPPATAAMLPLVGQKLALQDENLGTSLMSACIVAAPLVMVPVAMLVGARADAWDHKQFFLAALAILPIRGAPYTFSDKAAWLVGAQLLDGIGAGIFGATYPVIVADLMRNTGRFNVAQGVVITAQGIGAALSTALAGIMVVKGGFSAAFLALGAIAAFGFIVFLLAFPGSAGTGSQSRPSSPRRPKIAAG